MYRILWPTTVTYDSFTFLQVFSLLETLKFDLKESKYSQRLNKMTNQMSEKEKGIQRLNTIVYEVSTNWAVVFVSHSFLYILKG